MLRIHVSDELGNIPNNEGMFILNEKTGGKRVAYNVIQMSFKQDVDIIVKPIPYPSRGGASGIPFTRELAYGAHLIVSYDASGVATIIKNKINDIKKIDIGDVSSIWARP